MADGSVELETTSKPIHLSRISRCSMPPNSPIKYSKSGRTVRIPVLRIRCGKWDIRGEERWLEYEPASTKLKIVFHDRQHFEHEECVLFNLKDISAADLRVTAKFGCLDAMNGTLTLECDSRIEILGSDANPLSNGYVAEMTFHVNYTGQMRDILRSLRQAKLAEIQTGNNNDQDKVEEQRAILREGLPDWVQYIPHKVYTPFVRKAMEFCLFFYTIFSIVWALWQLYRHVDFIRTYVRPLIEALIYHIQTLDKFIQVANAIFEEYTRQWMAYLKPAYVILYTTATPLINAGKQVCISLSSLSSVFKSTVQPLVFFVQPLLHVLNIVFVRAPASVLKPLYHVISTLWSLFYETVGQKIYLPHCAQFFRNLMQVLGDILERSVRLDPLKAQLILMRSNVLNSGKALGLGLVYIYKRIERRVWLIFRSNTEDKED